VRFLEETGVDTAYAGRLLREYGNDVIDILCNDPYRVAEDIPRIGFRIADAIVRHADTPVDEMDRARACMFHLFEQAVDQGHAYIAQDQLFDQCREAFDVNRKPVAAALNHLVQTGELVVVDPRMSIRPWSFPGCSTRPKP
jgi:exodeoxyribonuclease V alpha subunit